MTSEAITPCHPPPATRPPIAVDATAHTFDNGVIMSDRRVGIWLIGARGGVGCTAILGLAALKKGLIAPDGLVSCLPQFRQLGLSDWGDFVVGGHEIRSLSLFEEAMRMATENRIAPPALVEQCRDELEQIDGRIRPGTIQNVGPTIAALADESVPRDETPRQAIARLGRDMAAFVQAEGLGPSGGGERGLDGAAGGCFGPAVRLGGTRPAAM